MSDDNCLDASQHDGPVKLVRCHGMGGNQAWVYNEKVCSGITAVSYTHLDVYKRQILQYGHQMCLVCRYYKIKLYMVYLYGFIIHYNER